MLPPNQEMISQVQGQPNWRDLLADIDPWASSSRAWRRMTVNRRYPLRCRASATAPSLLSCLAAG